MAGEDSAGCKDIARDRAEAAVAKCGTAGTVVVRVGILAGADAALVIDCLDKEEFLDTEAPFMSELAIAETLCCFAPLPMVASPFADSLPLALPFDVGVFGPFCLLKEPERLKLVFPPAVSLAQPFSVASLSRARGGACTELRFAFLSL